MRKSEMSRPSGVIALLRPVAIFTRQTRSVSSTRLRKASQRPLGDQRGVTIAAMPIAVGGTVATPAGANMNSPPVSTKRAPPPSIAGTTLHRQYRVVSGSARRPWEATPLDSCHKTLTFAAEFVTQVV